MSWRGPKRSSERWLWRVGRLLLLVALGGVLSACGSEEGRKHAVECRADEDCDGSSLGECETVACVDGRCEHGTLPDGHHCSDDDPLTGDDACQEGICEGVPKTCDDALDPCLQAVLDPDTNKCRVEPVEDGTPCDDDDACTRVDTCQAGSCVGGKAKSCEPLDACHVAGECDPETGECSDEAAPDGTPCDDAHACTADDSCQGGECVGMPVACDDGLACSEDSCDEKSGACVADMSGCSCESDADCDDGNACNGSESCDPTDKLCRAGTPVVCAASGDPCQLNRCQPDSGECELEPVVDGAACDDGDACTTGDSCQSGACVGADEVVCTALSQCHLPGTCDPETGACSNPEKAKGSACSDGNACTTGDTCQGGQCVGSGQVKCTPSDQCHVAGVCNAATGVCSNPAQKNGVKCDDGDACSSGDACQSGVCKPAAQVVCTALDGCHTAGVCDPSSGLCSNPAKSDGSACDDGSICTTGDSCAAGKCSGKAKACDDGIACTVDSCSEQLGGCTSSATACACQKDADCDDKNPCNGVETCNLQTLQCKAGTPVDCSGLDDACNVGTCSSATGKCSASAKADGTSCDDENACTKASSCQKGVCQGSSPVTCVASDQCHDAGTCNTKTGACSNPAKTDGSACNDGNACTQSDSCQSGVCTGSNAVVCSASDQCHDAGSCDSSSGLCSNPAKKNGSTCSDGSACTQTDSCQGGVCSGGNPVVCSPSDQCHGTGSCNASSGKCSNPAKKDGSVCDDGDLCTQTDSCQSGACSGADPVVCKALGQCYGVGTCNSSSGTCSNPTLGSGTQCDDGDPCTSGEVCNGKGACTAGVSCPPPANACQTNTCNVGVGCVLGQQPAGTPCDDLSACTLLDQCLKGKCVGSRRSNAAGDWADDPGARSVGPVSVDVFTDQKSDVHIVGTYLGSIGFDDKDDPKTATVLALPQTQSTGIYWAVYGSDGSVLQVANLGGVASGGNLTVTHATGHGDGSFTLLGTLQGGGQFGLNGKTKSVDAKLPVIFVAHYASGGEIAWVATFAPGDGVAYTASSVAAFDDGAVIATGAVNGTMTFRDGAGTAFGSTDRLCVWAARLDASGKGQWGQLVVLPESLPAVPTAVTTHEDGSASLTGLFQGNAGLGPKGELKVSVSSSEERGRDIWFEKLGKDGSISWGGRVGGLGLDVAGDVARLKGGGLLLLANTLGSQPNADDAKTTEPLHSTATTGLQTHVLGMSSDGVLQSDALIANAKSGSTRGWQLKRDANGALAVAGTFAGGTQLWSQVGLGQGAPSAAADFTLSSLYEGPLTLFAARVDEKSKFAWAVQAGGDGSSMTTGAWDLVASAHPDHSLTLAGIFNADATFGDQAPEALQAAPGSVGNPFVVHLNSQAEYDYCP